MNDMEMILFQNTSTLPETNSSPLKIGHPQKETIVVQPSIFRGHVNFREGIFGWVVSIQGVTGQRVLNSDDLVVFRTPHSSKYIEEKTWRNTSSLASDPSNINTVFLATHIFEGIIIPTCIYNRYIYICV